MKSDDIYRLFNETDPELVSMLLDIAHVTAGGGDALAIATHFKDRVKHVHLKDIRNSVLARVHAEGLSFEQAVEDGIFTVPGDEEGSITTIPAILRVLADAKFTGWFTVEAEQDPRKRKPLEYAFMARDFIRANIRLEDL